MPRKRPPAAAIETLLQTLAKDPAIAPSVADLVEKRNGSGFGANALKVNGKLFALFTQGTLVVKLPKARVDALVAAKAGTPFDPGHGRKMKEWIALAKGAPWAALATEAFGFVGKI